MSVESRSETVETVKNLNDDIKDLEVALNDIKEKTGLFSEYSPFEGMDKVIDTISSFIQEKNGTINYISNALNNGIANQEVSDILSVLISKVDLLIVKLKDNSTWVGDKAKGKFNILLVELNNLKSKIT